MTPLDGPLPAKGGATITVPGHVEAWDALHARFGQVELARCLEPAIRLARYGFPVGPVTSAGWVASVPVLRDGQGTAELFLFDGRAPDPGAKVANPALGHTLSEIAKGGARAFYEGRVAEAVVGAARQAGSALSLDDLSGHRGEWVEPLRSAYAGWEVLELPPNGQGAVVVGALSVLDGGSLDLMSASRVHFHVEAIKAAFTEGSRCIGDPRAGGHAGGLVDPAWVAAARAGLPNAASSPPAEALPTPGGTVYVAVADESMTASLISSNYEPFGSAVAVLEGGFVLQNRGGCFRALAPEGHPNRPAPGRRPYHTIIPALVRRPGGTRFGALGVVGGDFQPQGQIQVVHHLAAGLEPQPALDAPRWRWLGGRRLALEAGLAALGPELRARGHSVIPGEQTTYGGAQLVVEEDGFWWGACESRQDSLAAGF